MPVGKASAATREGQPSAQPKCDDSISPEVRNKLIHPDKPVLSAVKNVLDVLHARRENSPDQAKTPVRLGGQEKLCIEEAQDTQANNGDLVSALDAASKILQHRLHGAVVNLGEDNAIEPLIKDFHLSLICPEDQVVSTLVEQVYNELASGEINPEDSAAFAEAREQCLRVAAQSKVEAKLEDKSVFDAHNEACKILTDHLPESVRASRGPDTIDFLVRKVMLGMGLSSAGKLAKRIKMKEPGFRPDPVVRLSPDLDREWDFSVPANEVPLPENPIESLLRAALEIRGIPTNTQSQAVDDAVARARLLYATMVPPDPSDPDFNNEVITEAVIQNAHEVINYHFPEIWTNAKTARETLQCALVKLGMPSSLRYNFRLGLTPRLRPGLTGDRYAPRASTPPELKAQLAEYAGEGYRQISQRL